jgi:hypothetical protein
LQVWQYLFAYRIAVNPDGGEVRVNASVTMRPVTRSLLVAEDVAPGRKLADLAARAEKVAAVAAAHAAAVDSDSRVPAEAIDAARAERLLGAAVPRELGGEGASISDIVDVCSRSAAPAPPRP